MKGVVKWLKNTRGHTTLALMRWETTEGGGFAELPIKLTAMLV